MEERVQGIVIRTAEYKEKDRILTLFTPQGIRTVTARGVRSDKAKLKSAANVFSFGEYAIGGKQGALTLRGAEITDPFYTVWSDLDKAAALTYCFELTEKCFSSEEDTGKEFIFLLRTMKEIAYGQTDPICLAFAYTVFCARSMGVDYTEIAAYDEEAYAVAEAFAVAGPEDAETLPYAVGKVKHALTLVHTVFKNKLDVKATSLKTLLR